jgi:hypothetical protein
MKKVRCHFKYIGPKQIEALKGRSCLLTISVGQGTHEDQRLEALIDLVCNSFSSVTIALHDTLQRHTIALGYQEEADYFYSIAKEAGDRWLERNEKYFSGNAPTIVRWDSWLQDPRFNEYKEHVLTTMRADESYAVLFDQTVDDYLARYGGRLGNPALSSDARARQLCLDYLVEECAALYLWPSTQCDYEIYTGKHNAAMVETKRRFIAPKYPQLVESLPIAFNKRPNLKPQQFEESVEASA